MSAVVATRSNLGRRLVTAALLIPAALAAILWLPRIALAGLFGAVTVLGAAEWAVMAGLSGTWRGAYVAASAALLVALYAAADWWPGVLGLGMIWWAVALLLVLAVQTGMAVPDLGRPGRASIGWLVLVPAWTALLLLYSRRGPVSLAVLMGLVWIADSAAYFAGRRWGRRRLAPRISPGKTWEGLAGALVATLSGAAAVASVSHMGYRDAVSFAVLALATVMASVLGDLVESLFKRWAGLKDSGTLLPGHGGVLDRIDSLTAAAPVFALGLLLLEIPL